MTSHETQEYECLYNSLLYKYCLLGNVIYNYVFMHVFREVIVIVQEASGNRKRVEDIYTIDLKPYKTNT